ncbi:hypothetical protein EHQ61_08580, partial [Leptospira wolffii]|uniref:SpvB/TcaC N-terminal domain-containing protein n=1 Tax=Leptospira wolffii TaxID=409998 RepID=UPI001083E953
MDFRKKGLLFLTALLLFADCRGGKDLLDRVWDKIGGVIGLPPGTSFPSPGSAPAPEGSDLFSISTNYSQAIDDPSTKADPLSGASFIAPPEPNNYGAVSLSYPIQVTPGRAGIQPNLAISYSSTGGDGWAGVGWSIGLGAITRTPEYGALYYDSRDFFTWNGKRLIKVSGSSSSENGTYRAEITDQNAPILILTNIESGGVWEVRDSSGTKTIYGDNSSNRIYNPDKINQTYSWYLSKVEDRNGNYMQVTYDTSQYAVKRNLYLKEIKYTGNSRTGTSPRQYVRFNTKSRDDSYVSTAPGFLMKMDRLLDSIEVGWDGGKLWEYDLVYDISPDSGRPILKTVDSTRNTTKPEFSYQTATRSLFWQNVVNQASSETEVSPESTEYFEGDFNGDGISDIVFFNPQSGNWKAAEGRKEGGYNFKTYANRYKNYEGTEKIRFFKGNVSGDFNGDGRSDIAFYLPETRDFIVAEHDGRVFQFKNYGRLMAGIPDIFRMEWFPGDYDGNGLTDSVLFDEPTGQWTLMLNKGGSFEFLRFSSKFQNLFRGDYSPNANLDSVFTTDLSKDGIDRAKVQLLIGDYNGDGRTDISVYDSRSGKWLVGENYRNDNSSDPIYFKLQWKLYKVFTAPEQTLFGFDRFSGDFNGDGTSDFLLFDRSSGEWTIGETSNGTINFRTWSKAPQFKEITRWLQGDFNGDGRTDIGFFSVTDGKFWIGESTLNGFRYKIYSDMNYGPSIDRVMKTPLPLDEVKLTQSGGTVYANSNQKTLVLSYLYDGNINPNRGEIVYPGCFSVNDCLSSPELLIYDRQTASFNFKQGTGVTNQVLTGLNPEATANPLLFGGKPSRYSSAGKDEILYYKKNGNVNQFSLIKNTTGTSFTTSNFASFTDTNVANFNLSESMYLVDNFESTSYKSILVLDDQSTATPGSGRFYLVGPTGTSKALTPATDVTSSYLFNLFQNGSSQNRLNKKSFSFFSGDFTNSGKSQILFVDRRTSSHKWYLGTIGTSTITFTLLGTQTLTLAASEYDSSQAGFSYGLFQETTGAESIVFADPSDSGFTFYKLRIGLSPSPSISMSAYAGGLVGFTGQFDHKGNPIITSSGDTKIYDIAQSKIVSLPATVIQKNLDRPDLMSKVYVFRWIQGDYNGDGLTDIGIIHLKEPTWYFAMSDGIVPDIINKIKNGIGGWYELEYSDSTKFDNTGGDGVPDLPGHYRVCTKITVDDGFGNRIPKTYDYEAGYAFSAFINGKVEKDFFGFGKFTQKDGYGVRTVHTYNNVPYSNFMMNRALGGAEKESHVIGSDNQDYGSRANTYDVKVIDAGGGLTSYLLLPIKTDKFQNGTKTLTSEVSFQFNGYNLTKQTNSDTDWFSDSAHTSTTRITITDYETDSTTNQLRVKKVVELAASANETTTVKTYDSQGNTIRKQTSYTGSGLAAVSPKINEYTYDPLGNVLSEKDVSGNPARGLEYVYDNELKLFVTEKTSFGGSLRFRTQYQIDYTSAFGSPLQVTDPNGNKSYYEYDSFGRSLTTKVDTDDGTKVLATYSYNASFPLSAKSVLPAGGWDPDFATRSYVDGIGRAIYTVKTGSDGKTVRSGRVVYDAAGRMVRQGQADWTDSSELDNFAMHLEEKNPTSFEYDAIGRIKTSTLPLAQGETSPTILSITYNDPYEKIEIHSSGTRKRKVTDGRGQTLYVEDSGGDGIVAQIGFCYDLAGNRTKKSDLNDGSSLNCSNISTGINQKDISGKNQAYWAYDGFGKVRVQSDPDFGVEKHEYNSFGEAVKTTDAIGRVTTLVYDSIGRMVTKRMPEGEIYYTYDSRSGSENALGKLVLVEDRNQTKTFSYDKLGRVKKETRAFKEIPLKNSDLPYITEYAYDLLGRVTKIDYPAHPVNHTRLRACYSYGSAGYITGISVQVNTNGILPGLCNKTIVENITYNEFGQTSAFTMGNGIETRYYYDEKLRMTRLNSSGVVDGYSETLQNAVYTFNSKNNITSIENTGTRYQTKYDFAYDGLSRLTNASGFYTEPAETYTKKYQQSFAYAKNGNLTAKRVHNPTDGSITDERIYQYNNHQASYVDSSKYGSGAVTMTYDASGNMISQRDRVLDKTKKMEYDSDNRIIRIRDENNYTVGRYWYDDGGFRIHKSALIPDGAQSKHQEILYPSKFYGLEYMDEENVLRSINNIYLNGVRIAALNEQGTAAYYLTDQVDSVSHVLDDQGKTLTRIQNDPYGDSFVQRGNLNFSPKFNSQELDQESGFYFYNARYYDASIARFLTADSIIDGAEDTQGWNRYLYVRGNPINAKDPTGHE